MNNQLKLALFNARKTFNMNMAINWGLEMNKLVILGEDGKYMVPATNREAGLLIKAGYQVLEIK